MARQRGQPGELQPEVRRGRIDWLNIYEISEAELELLARGSANKEIAQKMGVSVSTVHFHLKSIYQKLHVRSRTEATLRYLQTAPAEAHARP